MTAPLPVRSSQSLTRGRKAPSPPTQLWKCQYCGRLPGCAGELSSLRLSTVPAHPNRTHWQLANRHGSPAGARAWCPSGGQDASAVAATVPSEPGARRTFLTQGINYARHADKLCSVKQARMEASSAARLAAAEARRGGRLAEPTWRLGELQRAPRGTAEPLRTAAARRRSGCAWRQMAVGSRKRGDSMPECWKPSPHMWPGSVLREIFLLVKMQF